MRGVSGHFGGRDAATIPKRKYPKCGKARAEARKTGGGDYRAVEQRSNGLFVGNVCIDEPDEVASFVAANRIGRRSPPGRLYSSAQKALGLSSSARLHYCRTCDAPFIAHPTAARCLSCRKAEQAEALAARNAKRAEAREIACTHCGQPAQAARSTKRFCSDRCRQTTRRTRLASTGKRSTTDPLCGTRRRDSLNDKESTTMRSGTARDLVAARHHLESPY